MGPAISLQSIYIIIFNLFANNYYKGYFQNQNYNSSQLL